MTPPPINFDLLVDRSNTDSCKWSLYSDVDVLPLWVADTDFMVAPEITEALQQRVAHGIFGYTNTPNRLTELIVERMQRLYGWSIDPSWLVWMPGVVSSMHVACRSICDATDSVLTPSVAYPYFHSAPGLSERDNQPMAMIHSNRRWVIDQKKLMSQIDSSSKLMLFCNPHNPGGAVYTRSELLSLADLVVSNDLVVCSDEIHCDLVLEAGMSHIPIASLNKAIEKRSITLMAPSKTFNIAGLSCSFAIIPDDSIRRKFSKACIGIIPYLNLLGTTAAQAAYEYGDDWNNQQVIYLRANRDYLVAEINQIRGLKLDPIEATYLAWIDVSELGLIDSKAFFEAAGVGLSAGIDFGDNNYLRLNFGCPRSLLEEAVKRIRVAVSNHWSGY
ncbi:MAG: cystathionine beta-lyase [Candidatus Azotimanducaceae bacterium]|jgi:cystathionine beta-lyase